MPIKEVKKDSHLSYKVRVSVRSSVDPTLRKHKEGTAKTLSQARTLERKLLKEAQQFVSEREKHGLSWAQVLEAWEIDIRKTGVNINGRKVQSTTIDDNVAALNTYTKDWLEIPAALITPSDVRIVLNFMADLGLSHSRIKAIKYAINCVFQWAILERKVRGLIQSPAIGVPIISNKPTRAPLILTQSDLTKLLHTAREANHEWYPHWTMAALTGMRSGELLALRWSDIDLTDKIIRVQRSYNGRLKKEKCPKNTEWRQIPINHFLESILKELKARDPRSEHVLPRVGYWKRGEAAKPLRVFCRSIGVPEITFHTFRACFTTHLLQKKVPVPIVQAIGGWRDLKSMNRYVRLAGVDIEGATDNLEYLKPRAVMEKAVINLYESRPSNGA